MNEGSFGDVLNNVIENLAGLVGAGPLVGWIRRLFGGKAVDYQKLQDSVNQVISANRNKGQQALDEVSNNLNRLRQIIPSVATKEVLDKAIANAKNRYKDISQKINLAEAYENSANSLANQLSMMTENQRMSTQAKDMDKDAQTKLKQAQDIYSNIASSYEKQNEIGGNNNV